MSKLACAPDYKLARRLAEKFAPGKDVDLNGLANDICEALLAWNEEESDRQPEIIDFEPLTGLSRKLSNLRAILSDHQVAQLLAKPFNATSGRIVSGAPSEISYGELLFAIDRAVTAIETVKRRKRRKAAPDKRSPADHFVGDRLRAIAYHRLGIADTFRRNGEADGVIIDFVSDVVEGLNLEAFGRNTIGKFIQHGR